MRCAVIDQSGAVVNIILADPALDSLEGLTLIGIADDAWVTDQHVWDGVAFVPSQALLDQMAADEAALEAAILAEALA